MNKRTNYAPLLVAIILLLLPVTYVGTYFAIVAPSGVIEAITVPSQPQPTMTFVAEVGLMTEGHYRFGGDFAATIFWPLEQLDRKVRPGVWNEGY